MKGACAREEGTVPYVPVLWLRNKLADVKKLSSGNQQKRLKITNKEGIDFVFSFGGSCVV